MHTYPNILDWKRKIHQAIVSNTSLKQNSFSKPNPSFFTFDL